VVPFLAHLPDPVPAFIHDRRELEGVIEIPLERLLDDDRPRPATSPGRSSGYVDLSR